jgi:hypothetical protein
MPRLEELDLAGREIQIIAGVDNEEEALLLRQQAQHKPVDAGRGGDDTEIGLAEDRRQAFLEQTTPPDEDGRERPLTKIDPSLNLRRFGAGRRAGRFIALPPAGLPHPPSEIRTRVILIQLAHLSASSFSMLHNLRPFQAN